MGSKPTIPNNLSNEGRYFIRKCLEVDPNERWTIHSLQAHPFVKVSLFLVNLIHWFAAAVHTWLQFLVALAKYKTTSYRECMCVSYFCAQPKGLLINLCQNFLLNQVEIFPRASVR